jgi:hypothetical protein
MRIKFAKILITFHNKADIPKLLDLQNNGHDHGNHVSCRREEHYKEVARRGAKGKKLQESERSNTQVCKENAKRIEHEGHASKCRNSAKRGVPVRNSKWHEKV